MLVVTSSIVLFQSSSLATIEIYSITSSLGRTSRAARPARTTVHVRVATKPKRQYDDNDEIMEENDNVVDIADHKQLAKEELELLKLASKPLPQHHDTVDDNTEKEEVTCNKDASQDSNGIHDNKGIVHQGLLVWMESTLSAVGCHVQVYDCGLLVVGVLGESSSDHDESKQQQQEREQCNAYILLPTSTCNPRVDNKQLLHIRITGCYCVSCTQPLTICPELSFLEFQVESTWNVGYKWITSIQQVIQELQHLATLQDEIWKEWKDDYNVVLSKQQRSFACKEEDAS